MIWVRFLGLAMLDGYVYAVGGWEGSSRLDSVEKYDPETNVWTPVASLKMAVTSPAVVAHEGRFIFIIGIEFIMHSDAYHFFFQKLEIRNFRFWAQNWKFWKFEKKLLRIWNSGQFWLVLISVFYNLLSKGVKSLKLMIFRPLLTRSNFFLLVKQQSREDVSVFLVLSVLISEWRERGHFLLS